MRDDQVKCRCCGENVYYFDLGNIDDDGYICNRCWDRLHTDHRFYEEFQDRLKKEKRNTKIKSIINKVFAFITVHLMFLILFALCILFLYFWIGGCIGNALNTNEEIPPGLHWKP